MIKKVNIHELTQLNDFMFDIRKSTVTSDFQVHRHDFSELVLISGGKATHVVDGWEYPIEAGHVFVVSGDTSHGYKNAENLMLYNVVFDANRMLSTQDDLRKMSGFQTFFVLEPLYFRDNLFRSRMNLSWDNLNHAIHLLEAMFKEYYEGTGGSRTVVQAYLSILFVFLSRTCESNNAAPSQMLNIAEAVSYMESNYLSDLSVKAISDKSHLSTRQFFRIFRKSYNTTPMEYIIRLRIKYACTLLKNTNLTITEVSSESGFHDPNYFTRGFKKVVGVSPRDFKSNQTIHDISL